MREIKFRGQDKRGAWHYGYLVVKQGNAFIGDDLLNSFAEHEVDIKSVGQFTGLKDKNGKEIYERDILKVISKEDKREHIIEVEFICHSIGDFKNWEIWGFRDYSKSTYGCDVEVIGNKFENQELLEGEK